MPEIIYSGVQASDRSTIRLKMTLLSDTILGNGMSIPGEEDISVLVDDQGFPYYKGSTFKGVFREEMERFLAWNGKKDGRDVRCLFGEGKPGIESDSEDARRLVFSDFVIFPYVRKVIMSETGDDSRKVLDCLSHMRAFTRISDAGTAEKGSLRYARCINQGIVLYSTVSCSREDERLVKEILPFVKWIGTMRNRGFGHVSIEPEKVEGKDAAGNGGGDA